MPIRSQILIVILAVGCSSTTQRSPRPVPLPPNVEADELSSINPEPIPQLTKEQREYLEAKDPSKADAPPAAAPLATAQGRQTAPLTMLSKMKNDRASKPKLDATAEQQMKGKATLEALRADLKAGKITEEQFATQEAKAFEALQIQKDREFAAKLPKPGAKYNILALCGGVAHGAFQAGVLCGWTQCGGRPDFDVVTGVSTGALVAAMVFPGPEYDPDLKHFYTTVHTRDIYRVKAIPPLGLRTTSVATSEPLRKLAEGLVNRPGYMEKVAAEHARGRRFYAGTTNLDTMRFVVWDMGAIASQGTCESRKLYVDILMGACAMPPLLSPSRIQINIDGKCYEEMHVDGGTTRNLFFYPPSDWVGREQDKNGRLLAGANVYCIVGGKVYDDPIGVKPHVLPEGVRALSTLLASSQRAELFRLHAYCQTFDMNFSWAVIPSDYELFDANDFDPVKMTKLFNEGYCRVCRGELWNQESAVG